MSTAIVWVKVEMTGLRKTGRMRVHDKNWFPEMEACPEAKALHYSSDISRLTEARKQAAQDGWDCVLMVDSDDVLQRAREEALASFISSNQNQSLGVRHGKAR